MAAIVMVAEDAKPTKVEPQTFNEVWNNPDPESQHKQKDDIRKEFNNVNKKKVYRKVQKSLMPPNYWCIKHKGVYKIKCNSVITLDSQHAAMVKSLESISLKIIHWL